MKEAKGIYKLEITRCTPHTHTKRAIACYSATLLAFHCVLPILNYEIKSACNDFLINFFPDLLLLIVVHLCFFSFFLQRNCISLLLILVMLFGIHFELHLLELQYAQQLLKENENIAYMLPYALCFISLFVCV